MLDQAEVDVQSGRLEQAQRGLESVLKLDPDQVDALYLLGVIALQNKDLEKCSQLLGQAVALDPGFEAAHVNLGMCWLESKQPAKALASFDQAIALKPDFAEACFGRGVAQIELKQYQAALGSLSQGLALQPENFEAHYNMGNALLALQHFADADESYQQALKLHPSHVGAMINRGHAQLALKRPQVALASYDAAAAVQPDRLGAQLGRGDALLAMGRIEEALAAYERSVLLKPDHGAAQANRGIALQKLGRIPEAIESYERALKLDANQASCLANLGGALRDAGRCEEAERRCLEALAMEPKLVTAHLNHAHALLDQGKLDAARQAFAQACALQPDDADMQWARGCADLLAGDWARGLPLFESRSKKSNAPESRGFKQPLWLGDADLRGKTILLHAEQGMGDTLLLSRYVPLVTNLGARVVLEVQPALKSLMATLFSSVQVVVRGDWPLPPFDYHCPLMSLPLAFKSTPTTVPPPASSLIANARLAAVWNDRLGHKTGPRVGICWAGNGPQANDQQSGMSLSDLLSALPQGPQYVCLQKDIGDADKATLAQHPEVLNVSESLQTIDDAAALVGQMDLVVSIDNWVAHLAGSLGKPSWVLLTPSPDWRWLMARSDSPWYPSVKLARQTVRGQWAAPLQQVANGVKALLH